jgi:hypothetical protein
MNAAERADLAARAVDELTAAIVHALEVCDALDDGFRTEWGTQAGTNLPELLAAALTRVADLQGSYRLVEHRPGCWEAEHVAALDLSAIHVPMVDG